MSMILLKQICNMMFEPFWILSIIGIGTLGYGVWRNFSYIKFFLLLTLILMFCLRWEVGLSSSRYAASFTFVGIGFAGWIFSGGDPMTSRIINYRVRPLFNFKFGTILIVVTIILCLGKAFGGLEANVFAEAGRIIKSDSEHYQVPVIISFNDEHQRLSYYSGIQALYNAKSNDGRLLSISVSELLACRLLTDAAYVAVTETAVQPEIYADNEYKWTLIFNAFRDHRKKKRLMVFRVEPRKAAQPASTKNSGLVTNGTFESIATANEHKYILQKLRERHESFYEKNVQLPSGWGLGNGFMRNSNHELELTQYGVPPQNALRICARTPVDVFYASPFPSGRRYRYSFSIQSLQSGRLGIEIYLYDKDNRFISSRRISEIALKNNDQGISLGGVFSVDDPPELMFRIAMVLDFGEVLVDSFALFEE